MLVKVKVAQSCLTLCNPMDYTVHGIPQARILEWVVFPFSRGSSQSRDQTQIFHIAGRFFTSWATREAQEYWSRVVYLFSRGSSWPRNWTAVSRIAGRFFTNWAMSIVKQLYSNKMFWKIRDYWSKSLNLVWENELQRNYDLLKIRRLSDGGPT